MTLVFYSWIHCKIRSFTINSNLQIQMNMLAQRYNITPEDGEKGLILTGIVFLLVAVFIFITYIRYRNRKQ